VLQKRRKVNWTYRHLVDADVFNLLGRNTEVLFAPKNEAGIEENIKKTTCMLVFIEQNVRECYKIE
jgi:hypothetical protein